jgi:16S rRNA processing protein RimM
VAASTPEPVIVGKISAAYGIKGWVKIHSYTDPDTRIFEFRQLQMQRGDAWVPVEIDASRRHGKGLVAHIVGCDDRNQAALLARHSLAVSADELPEAAADEVYWRDLEGMAVYARSGDGAVLLGQIAYLFATGANDVMVVASTAESIDDRERMIPWVPAERVLEVDTAARRVLVDWDPDF